MLEGKEVKAYFENHPEAKATLERTELQFECWRPGLSHNDMYRLLTVEDVRFITFSGWFDEPGVYAWIYPDGVPHYVKIADENEEGHARRSPTK